MMCPRLRHRCVGTDRAKKSEGYQGNARARKEAVVSSKWAAADKVTVHSPACTLCEDPPSHTHTRTLTLAHSHTHTLTHSHTHTLAHSHTHTLTPTLTTHSLTHSLTHTLAHSHTRTCTRSLSRRVEPLPRHHLRSVSFCLRNLSVLFRPSLALLAVAVLSARRSVRGGCEDPR
jgi:hypothetical protein